ncbi:hypothetical protein ABQ153_21990, partial [Xanthomonas sp. WHRI 8356]
MGLCVSKPSVAGSLEDYAAHAAEQTTPSTPSSPEAPMSPSLYGLGSLGARRARRAGAGHLPHKVQQHGENVALAAIDMALS